jgi:hypothetical protein
MAAKYPEQTYASNKLMCFRMAGYRVECGPMRKRTRWPATRKSCTCLAQRLVSFKDRY